MPTRRRFPGVYIREIDKSNYAEAIATTALGLVGVANKGPLHEPTVITSVEEFFRIFGNPPPLSGGKNERQIVTVTGNPTGGTFRLLFQSQQTATIAHSASAATVQTALRDLPAIGSTGVTVTGAAGGPWTVEFTGPLASRNVDLFTLGTNSLTGGSTPSVTIGVLVQGSSPPGDYAAHAAVNYLQNGRQLTFVRTCAYTVADGWLAEIATTPTYVDTGTGVPAGSIAWDRGSEEYTIDLGGATAGQFKLTYVAVQSADIAVTATAAAVQAALEAVSTIGAGNVFVTGAPGGPYRVKLIAGLEGLNPSDMTIQDGTSAPSGGSGTETCTATVTGDVEKGIIFEATSPGEWANDLQVRFTKVDGENSNEKVLLSVTGTTEGNFTLSFRGVATGNLGFDTTAALIEAALEGLSTVGTGNVTVTLVSTGKFLIEFVGTLAQTDWPNSTSGWQFAVGTLDGTPTAVEHTKGGVAVAGKTVYKVEVLAPVDNSSTNVAVVEVFPRLMLVNDASVLQSFNAYWIGKIVTGQINSFLKSTYITFDTTILPAAISDVRDEIATTANGTTGVTFDFGGGFSALDTFSGTDGEYSAAYVGTEADAIYGQTALQVLANLERVRVNLVALPGVTDPAALTELIRICEVERGDCVAFVDTPSGLRYDEAIAWHNKTGAWAQDGFKPNSSYAGLYWPWVKAFDSVNAEEVTLPPSCVLPGVFARSDNQSAPWYAPAGLKRGRILDILGLETPSPSIGALERMYTDGNVLNAIVDFRLDGPTVWGQRTTQRLATALDRMNVRRGVIAIQVAAANAVRFVPFDPNDDQTRDEVVAYLRPILEQVKNSRGLYEYNIVCDDQINTPDVIDRNELRVVIGLKPTKAAEFIYMDTVLHGTGADFTIPAETRT